MLKNQWNTLKMCLYVQTTKQTLTFQKKNFCFNESPLKMMKNAFYFVLKTHFMLEIFKFLA